MAEQSTLINFNNTELEDDMYETISPLFGILNENKEQVRCYSC
jgi:hypothetical protein